MRPSHQRGFTIIEALVALMILSIAATAVMSVFAVGARQIESRTARYELYREAKARLMLLKAEVQSAGLPFERDTAAGNVNIHETAEIAQNAGSPENPTALYEITVVVDDRSAANERRAELSGFVIAGARQ